MDNIPKQLTTCGKCTAEDSCRKMKKENEFLRRMLEAELVRRIKVLSIELGLGEKKGPTKKQFAKSLRQTPFCNAMLLMYEYGVFGGHYENLLQAAGKNPNRKSNKKTDA